MSPVLPREERDAIRARHLAWHNSDPSDATWPDDLAAVIVDTQSQSPRRAAVQAAMAHEIVREDVPALLDALDGAEAENEQHALANGGCVPADTYRDLAEHMAALRGRIEALADEWAQRVATVEHSAALRALAADEGERTGR